MIVKGTVRDDDGNTLPGASVYVTDKDGKFTNGAGTAADADGFYSINADPTQYLTAHVIGYQYLTFQPVRMDQDIQLSVANSGTGLTLQEATVTATRILKATNWVPIIFIGATLLLSFAGTFYFSGRKTT